MSSKNIRIPIAQATDDQLRQYCDEQQLELQDPSRSGMIAAIGTISVADSILITASEQGPQPGQPVTHQPQQVISTGLGETDPKWLVEIGETEMAGGKDPVPVAVNGRAVVIQRNMRVEMPHRYKLALDLAIRESIDQDERTHEITTSKVRNYPMTIISMPPEDEIAAWHARTGPVELGAGQLLPAA